MFTVYEDPHTQSLTHSLSLSHTHLSDLEQEGDPEGAEDFLMEMCDRNQHLAVLVQVYLVHWNLLGKGRKKGEREGGMESRLKWKTLQVRYKGDRERGEKTEVSKPTREKQVNLTF